VTGTAAGLAELGGGLLTAAGLASPAGPAAIAGTMAVASATHLAGGPFSANPGLRAAGDAAAGRASRSRPGD
jgi:putative oxidoreductase